MANIFGRQVVILATNKSGGGVVNGDVVIPDTSNDSAFTTTTSASVTGPVWIAQETIASNATGRVLVGGYASLVNVNASVTRGHFGATHTVAKQAADAGASRTAGTFCEFLTGGTTPIAYIWPTDLLGTSLSNPMSAKGQLIQGDTGGTPAALAVGTAGQVLTSGGSGAFNTWAAVATPSETFLTGDVTMTNANTAYTAITVTPAAGTYLIYGSASVAYSGGGSTATAELLAGATVLHSVGGVTTGANELVSLVTFGYATLNGSTAVLIQCFDNGAGAIIKATPRVNGTTNKQTKLMLVKIG